MQGSLPNLALLPQILQAHGQNMADEIAVRIAANLQMKHPTGTFTDSLKGESGPSGDGVVIRCTSSDPLAVVKLEPTSDHDITGNPTLVWEGGKYGAGMHFAHSVHHPGTIGLGVQVEAMGESLMQVVDDEWPQIVQELAVS